MNWKQLLGTGLACALHAYTPCVLAIESSFPAGDSGWHLGNLAVGNLDSEPDLEVIVPHRDSSGQWWLDAFKPDGTGVPGFPFNGGVQEINASPSVFDMNGDGRSEIAFTCGNQVILLNGDGTILWSNVVSAANYVPTGGYQVALGQFFWTGSSQLLQRLPSAAVFSSQVSPPLIADLDGDGAPEIVTGWKIDPDPEGDSQDYNPFINDIFGMGEWGATGETWSGAVIGLEARSGKRVFSYHLHHLVESGLATGRVAAGGEPRILVLNDSDSVVGFDPSAPHGLWGKGALHKSFGRNLRLMSGSYQVPIDIQTADLDGDGLDEVLVAGTQLSKLWQPNETILDDDGSVLWRRWMPHKEIQHVHGWFSPAVLIPCNPDGDNRADVLGFSHSNEITFRYWSGTELADHAGWPKPFGELLPTPPVMGDVDGDGAQEIVVGSYHPGINPSRGDLHVYELDGSLGYSEAVPGGLKHSPVIADLDQDGRVEIITRSLSGLVQVRSVATNRTGPAAWPAHRGGMTRNGSAQRLFPTGTPQVRTRCASPTRATLVWTNALRPLSYRILRSDATSTQHIATLSGNSFSFADDSLRSGVLYTYEIEAVYAGSRLRSPPIPLTAQLEGNLIANGGFEENSNSRWDKWFTGSLAVTNMEATRAESHSGEAAMRIDFRGNGPGGTIAQQNQYGIPDPAIRVATGDFCSFGGWMRSAGMSARSEQWFEWDSGKTGLNTNNRPARPWPVYFTPKVPLPSTSGWVYANRVFTMPAGIPNVEFWHAYAVDGTVNGTVYLDDVFFRKLPSPGTPLWQPLISAGARWRYFAADPPANWFAPEFDDSSWPESRAKFGAGSGPTNLVTRLPASQPKYYFRMHFEHSQNAIQDLLLTAWCVSEAVGADRQFRIFLNGSELPAHIEVASLQGNAAGYADLSPFAHLLKPGRNTLAVQMANAWSSWDDVAFDVALSYIPASAPCGHLVPLSSRNRLQLFASLPPSTEWRLQASSSGGPWSDLKNVSATNDFSGLLHEEEVQNTAGRYFRLVPR